MASLISVVPSPTCVELLLEELCPEQTHSTWKLTVLLEKKKLLQDFMVTQVGHVDRKVI